METSDPDDRPAARRRPVVAAAVVAAGFAVGLAVVWPAGTATVSGRVTRNGAAVRGTVTVRAADGTTRHAVIGPDGSYSIAGLPPGPAKLGVTARGGGGPWLKGGEFKTPPAADLARLADPDTSGLGTELRAGANTFPITIR